MTPSSHPESDSTANRDQPGLTNESHGDPDARADQQDPGIRSVYDHLLYGISLPERALRSTSAMVGGVLRESTELLVPQAFRSSRSYNIFVEQMLDFMAENVGGVAAEESEGESVTQVENYVARKTVGNFVEMAGWATMHISPMTVLAIVSDVAYGSKAYLSELSKELKEEGIIAQDSTIDSAADLLKAVSNASGVTAQAFDTPPISVDGLKSTIDQTRSAIAEMSPTGVIPKGEVTRLWNEMREVAKEQNVSLFDVSSAMSLFALGRVGSAGRGALSTVRVAGNMFDEHIIDHYTDGIRDIRERGIWTSLADSSRPYIDAVWQNFSSQKPTVTEDVLSGRMIGRAWKGMLGWFSNEAKQKEPDGVAGANEIDSRAEAPAEGSSDTDSTTGNVDSKAHE